MLRQVVAHLEACSVRYAVLHGWEQIDRLGDSDLDLVIHLDDLRLAAEQLALWPRARLLQVLQYEATSFGFVLDSGPGRDPRFLTVDLTTDYRWQGRVFLSNSELLGGLVRKDGAWLVAPDTELGFLLLKKLCEKDVIPGDQRHRLQSLVAQLGDRGASVFDQLLGPRWGGLVRARMARGEWSEVERDAAELRRAFRRHALRNDPMSAVRYLAGELPRKWRRWRAPTGLSVTVTGPAARDRATAIDLLRTELMGPFRRTAEIPLPKPPSQEGGMSATLVYLLERWSPHLRAVRPALARSTLVLLDDHAGPKTHSGEGRPNVRRLDGLVPRSDLALDLGPDPAGAAVIARERILDHLHDRSLARLGLSRQTVSAVSAPEPRAAPRVLERD
jgi:hypothetical protein